MPNPNLDALHAFLQEVGGGQLKQAGDQHGEDSIGGNTTHPTGSVDNGSQPATEGSRSAENSADVVDAIGAVSVDAQDGIVTDNGDSQPQIGLTQAMTGEDPAHTINGLEDEVKDDSIGGETAHPASTDNDAIKVKYAQQSSIALQKQAAKLGDDLLLEIMQSRPATKAAAAPSAAKPAAPVTKAAAAPTAPAAPNASHFTAGVEAIVKQASLQADLVANYLVKVAEELENEPEGGGSGDDEGEGGESGEGEAPSLPVAAGPAAPPDAGGGEGDSLEPELVDALESMGITSLDDLSQVISEIVDSSGGGGEAPGLPPEAGMPPEGGLPPEAGMPPEGGMPEPGMEVMAFAQAWTNHQKQAKAKAAAAQQKTAGTKKSARQSAVESLLQDFRRSKR